MALHDTDGIKLINSSRVHRCEPENEMQTNVIRAQSTTEMHYFHTLMSVPEEW